MFLIVVFLLWLIVQLLVPTGNLRAKAMLIKTRSDERMIATSLAEQAAKIGGLTNLKQQFVLEALFVENQNQIWLKTNAAGRVMDVWKTPYQIELRSSTNFIVRSAGPDQEFGNKDDIIFDGVSNDFVKP